MVSFGRLPFLPLMLTFWLIFTASYCKWMCRASDFPREYDGTCLQMRMSYSPAAHLFLFFVQWTDCNLAGALGLLRILIYKVRFKVFWFLDVNWEIWSKSQLTNFPHAAGVCGWDNYHVYP